jgi:hypothetical protein
MVVIWMSTREGRGVSRGIERRLRDNVGGLGAVKTGFILRGRRLGIIIGKKGLRRGGFGYIIEGKIVGR